MTIHHVEKISDTPCMPLAVQAWHELLGEGFGSTGMLLDWEQNGFYAVEDDLVVGILLYKVHEWNHSLNIALGYVTPRYRHRGIYRALFAKATEKAREKGCRTVSGATHWKNEAMRACMQRLGREPVWVSYEYVLAEPEQS